MNTTRFRWPVAIAVATLLFPLAAEAQAPADAPSTTPSATASETPKPSPTSKPTPAATPKPEPKATPGPVADTQKRLEHPVVLTDGSRRFKLSRRQLGFHLVSDAPVRFALDAGELKHALRFAAPKFAEAGVNAKPYLYKGHLMIQPGKDDRSLNVPTTAASITKEIAANPAATTFTVVLDKKSPKVLPADLKGITRKLSHFSTTADSTTTRNNNISIGVSSIDGMLLKPGATFSLNDTVGERTAERGFQVAHVFVDAKIVDGIGGGISQVTGTLFNAAALAGLQIREVNPHSRPVAYLPLGRDATVAYGDKDLKFTNNTAAPVYISYAFTHRRLTATIWGKAVPGRTISLHPVVQRLGPGKINAQLYRVVKEHGHVVTKERLLTHAYRWDPKAK